MRRPAITDSEQEEETKTLKTKKSQYNAYVYGNRDIKYNLTSFDNSSNSETSNNDHEDEDQEKIIKSETNPADSNSPMPWTTQVELIAPGVCLPGILTVTNEEFFFDVNERSKSFKKAEDQNVLFYTDGLHAKWGFHEVRAVFTRRHSLERSAVEVALANRNNVMFNFSPSLDPNTGNKFKSVDKVKRFVQLLPPVGIGTGFGLQQTRKVSLATPKQLFKWSNITKRWQMHDVSNFEYIMFLNTISGRTYQDLNQYPVFPWILSNYTSEDLDLTDEKNYRDLSKPIGALNITRAAYRLILLKFQIQGQCTSFQIKNTNLWVKKPVFRSKRVI